MLSRSASGVDGEGMPACLCKIEALSTSCWMGSGRGALPSGKHRKSYWKLPFILDLHGFTHETWWFSIVFCMFTRGSRGYIMHWIIHWKSLEDHAGCNIWVDEQGNLHGSRQVIGDWWYEWPNGQWLLLNRIAKPRLIDPLNSTQLNNKNDQTCR